MSEQGNKRLDELIDIAANATGDQGYAGEDRRSKDRFPYDRPVVMILMTSHGGVGKPAVYHAKDLSTGGICIISRNMVHPGQQGILKLIRSDGSPVLVGARIQHCRYVGAMQHETGMQFIPMPGGVTLADFLDESGCEPCRVGRSTAR